MKNIVFLIVIILFANLTHAQEAEQQFQGFNLQGYTEEGEKAWDVNGDTANIMGSEVHLSNVDANSYGDEKINVVAETGIIDQASGNMRLEKDVVITNEVGSRLITESLDWHRNDDLVTTEDDVFLSDERFTASGKGMDAQPGLKNAKIHEDVMVRVKTEDDVEISKVVTITSSGPMVIDQSKSMATFHDDVVAVQEDQTLKADKMDIYFKKGMDGIEKIVCSGNVEIEQGDNKTFANKAVYSAIDKRLTLSGRPKLILLTEGENAITTFGN